MILALRSRPSGCRGSCRGSRRVRDGLVVSSSTLFLALQGRSACPGSCGLVVGAVIDHPPLSLRCSTVVVNDLKMVGWGQAEVVVGGGRVLEWLVWKKKDLENRNQQNKTKDGEIVGRVLSGRVSRPSRCSGPGLPPT